MTRILQQLRFEYLKLIYFQRFLYTEPFLLNECFKVSKCGILRNCCLKQVMMGIIRNVVLILKFKFTVVKKSPITVK